MKRKPEESLEVEFRKINKKIATTLTIESKQINLQRIKKAKLKDYSLV